MILYFSSYWNDLRRREFVVTERLERAMAAAASMGSRVPAAARGIMRTL